MFCAVVWNEQILMSGKKLFLLAFPVVKGLGKPKVSGDFERIKKSR